MSEQKSKPIKKACRWQPWIWYSSVCFGTTQQCMSSLFTCSVSRRRGGGVLLLLLNIQPHKLFALWRQSDQTRFWTKLDERGQTPQLFRPLLHPYILSSIESIKMHPNTRFKQGLISIMWNWWCETGLEHRLLLKTSLESLLLLKTSQAKSTVCCKIWS